MPSFLSDSFKLGRSRTTGSNQRLNAIASINDSQYDTKNFKVHKWTRFSARGFELFVSVILMALLGKTPSTLANGNDVSGIVNTGFAISAISLLVAGFGILMYALPFFLHSWTSRRVLIIELTMDIIMTALFAATFVAAAVNTCPPGKCDSFNWDVVFLTADVLCYAVSVFLDVWSLLRGKSLMYLQELAGSYSRTSQASTDGGTEFDHDDADSTSILSNGSTVAEGRGLSSILRTTSSAASSDDGKLPSRGGSWAGSIGGGNGSSSTDRRDTVEFVQTGDFKLLYHHDTVMLVLRMSRKSTIK
ncbi:hypothetical protein SeMB42_g06933 [Synchytrium endobioticum]|uniref:MARVEL domain-containing protein n=1 Tax=Synchytrium endobioticum TaxID=286115 RepID=A0A507CGZ7_9FUNG|nr:hypothetical protein SeMB42_g06933 [Synchytrium endobioticum]